MIQTDKYYRSSVLDPEILTRSFQIQTNWHVITGAPSCGKTTLINQLADEGFQTVPETAHMYLEQELGRGRPLKEIFADRFELQRILIKMQRDLELELLAEAEIFPDRALPDSLAFNRFVGLDPNGLLPDCFHHHYATAFVLDPLPFHEDGVRDYDADKVDFLDEWLVRDYQALGYPVIRVPVLPPPERLAFVFKYL